MVSDKASLPAVVLLLLAGLAGAADTRKGLALADVVAASKPADWRQLDPENTLYIELASGRVVIELAPDFAPQHVANVKVLAREHYYDGLAVVRCQDNYVVQLADPDTEKPNVKRKIQRAKATLPPEFERTLDPKLPFTRLRDGDSYAPQVGFSGGFPMARDAKTGKMWLASGFWVNGGGGAVAGGEGRGAA